MFIRPRTDLVGLKKKLILFEIVKRGTLKLVAESGYWYYGYFFWSSVFLLLFKWELKKKKGLTVVLTGSCGQEQRHEILGLC